MNKKEWDIRVIVPTLNSSDYLEKCIASIRKETKCEYELTVVADMPSKETLAVLDKYDVKDRVINDKQVGCTKALNQGIEYKKADFYVILADDIIVTEGWLPGLLAGNLKQFVGHEQNIGLVSPLSNAGGQWLQELIQCDTEDYEEIQQIGRWVRKYHKDLLVDNYPLFGFCFVIPQHTIDTVGLFDDNLFTTHQDVDYCISVFQAGLRVMVHMGVFIYHKSKVTMSKLDKLDGYNKRWNEDVRYYNKKWNENVPLRPE